MCGCALLIFSPKNVHEITSDLDPITEVYGAGPTTLVRGVRSQILRTVPVPKHSSPIRKKTPHLNVDTKTTGNA